MTHPSIPIAADQALRMVLQATPTATPRSVPLLQAAGLRLAEDVRADRDYPPFDRAMMDGYGIRLADVGAEKPVRVVGQLVAGQAPTVGVAAGQCIEIMTGSACPEGTEAIRPAAS